jgi:hypothetical protein
MNENVDHLLKVPCEVGGILVLSVHLPFLFLVMCLKTFGLLGFEITWIVTCLKVWKISKDAPRKSIKSSKMKNVKVYGKDY